jgi:hypothetical protein
MTAAFSDRDTRNVTLSAHYAFDCNQYVLGVKNDPPARRKKRDAVSATVARGMEVLNSDNPPKSKEEAIRAIAGAVAMALAFLFPQYRLMIQVAGWLWDYLNATHESAGVSGEQ